MKDILNQLIEFKTLDRDTSYKVLIELAEGKYNNSQMAAFLTTYMMRPVTVNELEGFRDAMLDLCVRVEIEEYDAMDLCGTGGDGKDTFNISTLSSFIVAGAGQNVAKHGNNGVSSICGSSNLLQSLGYEFTNDVDELKSTLDRAGICFLHAPLFHPAMKNIAPIRRELGVKTFFNMLGPVVNPAFVKKQIVGVFNLELARLYGYLYRQTDKQFVILHALDGYDEISLTGSFKSISNQGEHLLGPADIGFDELDAEEIVGGKDISDSSKIFLDILKGNGTRAQRNVVVANAGYAIYAANQKDGIEHSINRAAESLDSGKAYETLKKFLNKEPRISINE